MRRGIADDAPLSVALKLLVRVRVLPRFDVLVRVFDHDHRGIDHRADGNRDASEGHDVGVDALVVHDDERHQHPERQRDDGDKRRAQVKEEHQAYQRHDNELLDELLLKVVHCALDKTRAVVGRDDLHPRRQAGFKLFQLHLDRADGLQCVLARAHDDNPAGHFALAVQLGDAAAHFRADLHARDIAQAHRNAGLSGHQWNGAKIVERLQVTGSAHHVLGLAQLQHRAAGLLVRLLYRVDHFRLGNVVSAHPVGIEHDLILADHAADARDFRHVGDRLQLVLEEPVLQRAQLRQVHLSRAVDQRVFVDPADASGIGAERCFGLRRQA